MPTIIKIPIGSFVIVYSAKDIRTLEIGEYQVISHTASVEVGTNGYLSHRYSFPTVLKRIN